MQIGKQNLILAHTRILGSDRLFDLDDHIARGPDLVRIVEHISTRFYILLVLKTRTFTRRLLHKNSVPSVRQCLNTRRREAHAVFVVLNFLRQSDLHK